MTKEFEIIRPKKKKRFQAPKPRITWIHRIVRFSFATFGRLFPKLFSKIAFRLFTTPRKRARHTLSDSILESAKISDLLYGRFLLKVYEWGSGPKTILLVHGWESRGTALRSFVPQLLKEGYKVVAFDAPAHGNSTGKRTNLPHFAGAVKAMLNRYSNIEGIIAHSFGGATSVYAMTKLDPSIEVEKLVLVGMPSRMETVLNDALDTMNAPPNVRSYFLEHIEMVADMSVEEMNISKMNTHLKVEKALVVHDMQDDIVDFEHAKQVADRWKDTELVITDGFGHFQLMKSEVVVDRVVGFLVRG